MGLHETIDKALAILVEIPVVRQVLKQSYKRKFVKARNAHLFSGAYPTFEEALKNAPDGREKGYDNPDSAELYLSRLTVDDYDYPSLFWVSEAISGGMRTIVDLGGSVGIKYYAFSKLIDFPVDLRWTVVDVPAVVVKGKEFSDMKASSGKLNFSDDYLAADGVDVLFCSGSLQYLPVTLTDIILKYKKYPQRIILNTTAIHPTDSFFTINNIGTAFCAYRVQSRESLVGDIQALGYTLKDSWSNVGKSMNLRFEKGRSISDYSGFCFDLADGRNDLKRAMD